MGLYERQAIQGIKRPLAVDSMPVDQVIEANADLAPSERAVGAVAD